jgi:hypothetical protein
MHLRKALCAALFGTFVVLSCALIRAQKGSDTVGTAPPGFSKINHVIWIIQENHKLFRNLSWCRRSSAFHLSSAYARKQGLRATVPHASRSAEVRFRSSMGSDPRRL